MNISIKSLQVFSETKSWIEMEYLFSIPAFSYQDSIKIMLEKKKIKDMYLANKNALWWEMLGKQNLL